MRQWGRRTSASKVPFERTSKRRRGYPSETRVKRGLRIVHGDKELLEKLGRNDLCPCGSGRRFQAVLHEGRPPRRLQPPRLLQGVTTMLGVRMSVRLNDRANLWLAEEACKQIELLLGDSRPATFDQVQDWLRREILEVEDYLKRLNGRDKRRKERWKRRPKPNREVAARQESHLEQIERRKWVMEARRHILRQIGDAVAWAILRINP
ncbi:MAG TPA: SEC-C metal-binding domain-containing protein, partial [Longimicrobium sp.]|nr:SEC-C metal-binding domain-containing protein [Longimicrobium sp.]